MRPLNPITFLSKALASNTLAGKAPAGALALLLVSGLSTGCSRNFWRTQADFDTYNELLKKTNDPRWNLPRVTVEPDVRSRLYDPYNPDCPPLPPDDPAAHRYMHWVSGREGYKSWHKFGDSMSVENPQWLAAFNLTPEKVPGAAPLSPDRPTPREVEERLDETPAAPAMSAKKKASDIRLVGAVQEDFPPAVPPAEPGAPSGTEVPPEPGAPAELPPPEAGPINAEDQDTSPKVELANEPRRPTTNRSVPTIEGLTLEQAIELANINSREYQTAIENVYLSSLDLTFQQFQFGVRYLGTSGREPGGSLTYLNTPGVRDDLALNTNFGVSQLLPSGGQIAAELANNTLWLFSGPNQTNSASVFSYSIVQPLLLGAGRKVVLENLTRQERQVLYDVRTLARYRKVFFGDTVVNGPGSGYLGLLRQYQQVRNQQDNIQQLVVQVDRLRELNSARPAVTTFELPALPPDLAVPADLQPRLSFRDGLLGFRGAMTPVDLERLLGLSGDPAYQTAVRGIADQLSSETTSLDIAQLVTRLANAQNNLRSLERQFEDNLDSYKTHLGLPPDFQISVDTGILKQFELTDPALIAAENAIVAYVRDLAVLDEEVPTPDLMPGLMTRFDELIEEVDRSGFRGIRNDFDRVAANMPYRLSRLPLPEQHAQVRKNLERDRRTFGFQSAEFNAVRASHAAIKERMAAVGLTAAEWRSLVLEFRENRETLLQAAQSLRVIQLGLRSELIKLQDFGMGYDEVVQIAVDNRLDLMNTRATVMDARRNMEVAANRLQAVVDLVASGDVGTSGGNRPFDFRGRNSTFRAGVQFTAPLDQINERNTYRESQIVYQRARRDYMASEDSVKQDVRVAWRQLTVLRQNFETARQSLRLSAMQLDLAIENSNAPAPAGAASRPQGGNQGLALLQALDSVLNAQNNLISIWVDYERFRINIHRDMDIMELDARGVWVDPLYQSSMPGLPTPETNAVPNGTIPTNSADSPAGTEPLPPSPVLVVPTAFRQPIRPTPTDVTAPPASTPAVITPAALTVPAPATAPAPRRPDSVPRELSDEFPTARQPDPLRPPGGGPPARPARAQVQPQEEGAVARPLGASPGDPRHGDGWRPRDPQRP